MGCWMIQVVPFLRSCRQRLEKPMFTCRSNLQGALRGILTAYLGEIRLRFVPNIARILLMTSGILSLRYSGKICGGAGLRVRTSLRWRRRVR